ncbi:MAG: carbon storage regulator [Candidatus Nealsonbacteria bacterium]|nr:carbon storage regulator [Candidatus Nealsonbacteria bacterium]
MLVLSRKCGQTVCIGQDITITFLRVGGHVTKIGIDAPSLVRILRGELCGRERWAEPFRDRARGDPIAVAADC